MDSESVIWPANKAKVCLPCGCGHEQVCDVCAGPADNDPEGPASEVIPLDQHRQHIAAKDEFARRLRAELEEAHLTVSLLARQKTAARAALDLLIAAVEPVLAAHKSTPQRVSVEQISHAWTAFDNARLVLGRAPVPVNPEGDA